MTDKTEEQSFNLALCEHARYAAQPARKRLGGSLTADNLQLFLADRECILYLTTIVYDRTSLDSHQFAQPLHIASNEGMGCELHIDPKLQQMTDLLYLVLAYMTAVINYADAATPDLAEMIGVLLTGMDRKEFDFKIFEIADSIQ